MDFISKTESDFKKLAQKFVADFSSQNRFALIGDLGSGKTTFVRYLAKELKIKENITSPTFVVRKDYQILDNKNFDKLVHIDAYRLGSAADVEAVGLFDEIENPKSLIFVEWFENINNFVSADFQPIKFQYLGENERKISW